MNNLVCLKPAPFLQSTSSSHSVEQSPSSQKLMDRTKSPPNIFFYLVICFIWMYITIWNKSSVTATNSF